MADKKITALSPIAITEVQSDDLLHIVDNPGCTPVNKKMSLATLFQNIPSTLNVIQLKQKQLHKLIWVVMTH